MMIVSGGREEPKKQDASAEDGVERREKERLLHANKSSKGTVDLLNTTLS